MKQVEPTRTSGRLIGAAVALYTSTIWNRNFLQVQLSLCPQSPLPVISTVRPRTEHPMPSNSRVNIRTESSRVSATMCLKKPRRNLPKLSSMSMVIDRR
jgi:hypothetical protein